MVDQQALGKARLALPVSGRPTRQGRRKDRRRDERRARAELAEEAADRRADDKADPEGRADEAEVARALLGPGDVGDRRLRRGIAAAEDAR